MRALIIAPHPDDEILGVGGVMARLREAGHDVQVTIVTTGQMPLFDEEYVAQVRREAMHAHDVIGLGPARFLEGFPAAGLDTIPGYVLNAAISEELEASEPDILFIPFGGDIHSDHQIIFTSALVAARPGKASPVKVILAYETLSETNWYAPPITPVFIPNTFIDISGFLERKVAAFEAYASQVQESPHERSSEAIRALARFRGATIGVEAAEAFVLIRQMILDSEFRTVGDLISARHTEAATTPTAD